MKTSEAFRCIKTHLWDGVGNRPHYKDTFICISAQNNLKYEERGRVVGIIEELLDGHTTLENWIGSKFGPLPQRAGICAKMQATRHAWLDHLIAHYESKGD